jgi:hypothetical protein
MGVVGERVDMLLHANYRFMAQVIAGFYCLLVENDGEYITDVIVKMRDEMIPEEYHASFNSAFESVCYFNQIDSDWLTE